MQKTCYHSIRVCYNENLVPGKKKHETFNIFPPRSSHWVPGKKKTQATIKESIYSGVINFGAEWLLKATIRVMWTNQDILDREYLISEEDSDSGDFFFLKNGPEIGESVFVY